MAARARGLEIGAPAIAPAAVPASQLASSSEPWTTITVEVRNLVYRGQFRLAAGHMLVVRAARGSTQARLGANAAAVLAETLLCELVAEGKA